MCCPDNGGSKEKESPGKEKEGELHPLGKPPNMASKRYKREKGLGRDKGGNSKKSEKLVGSVGKREELNDPPLGGVRYAA